MLRLSGYSGVTGKKNRRHRLGKSTVRYAGFTKPLVNPLNFSQFDLLKGMFLAYNVSRTPICCHKKASTLYPQS